MTTSAWRGPWTTSTRSSSMSLVALGPLIQVSGLVPSSRRMASGRIPVIRLVRRRCRLVPLKGYSAGDYLPQFREPP